MPNAIETRTVARMFARDPARRRVTFGGVTAYGLFRESDTTVDDGAGGFVRRKEITVLLPSGALALAEGSAVAIHATSSPYSTSTSYTVRDKLLQEDGLVTRYLLVPSA